MNIDKKYWIPAVLVVLAFCIGRFTGPAKVQTKEVEKVVTHKDESIDKNQDVTTTTKETRLPDGTIIKETTQDKKTETVTKRQSDSQTEIQKTQSVESRPGYQVGAIYQPAIINFQKASYSIILERRIISELYMGVSVSSDKTVGVVISIGF